MSPEEIVKLKHQLSPAKQKLLEKRLNGDKSSSIIQKLLPDNQATSGPISEEVYVSNLLSISKDWILDEHRNMGKATVPGTAYLEMARAAFEKHTQNETIEIREVYFLTPLVIEEHEEKEVRTLLKKQGDGFEFSVLSQTNILHHSQEPPVGCVRRSRRAPLSLDSVGYAAANPPYKLLIENGASSEQTNSGSEQWQIHAMGKIAAVETQLPKKYEITEIEATCNQYLISRQEFKIKSEFIERGARWNNLKWIKIGINKGLALLELPEVFTDDIKLYKLHPALLDTATAFMMTFRTNQLPDEGLYLPFSYAKLRIKGSLPLKVYSYIKAVENNQPQKESLTFNITIMDDQGSVLVEIEEYTLRKFRNQ